MPITDIGGTPAPVVTSFSSVTHDDVVASLIAAYPRRRGGSTAVAATIPFFNIADYGDLSTGAFAAFQAAITAWEATGNPGHIIVPQDITLSEASGGALRIPANAAPLRISSLPGGQRSTITLTRTVPRAFDLYGTGSGNTFSDITLENLAVDAGGVDHLTVAAAVSVTQTVTLSPSAWTTVHVSSSAQFQESNQWLWSTSTNSGTSAAKRYPVLPATGSSTTVQVYNASTSATLVSGDTVSGYLYDHVLFGNQHVGSTCGTVPVFRNITLRDITVTNVPSTQVASLSTPSPCTRFGISLYAEAGTTMSNIRCERVRITGGDAGFYLAGSAGGFIDDVHLRDCTHDTAVTPASNWPSLNALIGQNAWVGRVTIRDFVGANSGDVGLELDQPWVADISGCDVSGAYSADYYVTNFAAPASSVSGPPTATAAGSLNDSATTVTTSTLPTGIDSIGYATIDSEVVRYKVTGTTSLTIARGIDGSTAASHTDGATFTFQEARKQRIRFRDCVSRGVRNPGKGWWYNTNSSLPLPEIILRDCDRHSLVTDLSSRTEAVIVTGNVAEIDMAGFTSHVTVNSSETSGAVYNMVNILRSGNAGAEYLTAAPCLVRIRDSVFRLTGKSSSGSGQGAQYRHLFIQDGWWDVDLDVRLENTLRGVNIGESTGVFFGGSAAACLVQGGRVRIAYRSSDISDTAPQVLRTAGSISVSNRVDVELDLSHYYGTTNTIPWNIDSANRDKFHYRRVTTPQIAPDTYHAVEPLHRVTTAISYTATHADRYIAVTGTASAWTIALPETNQGNSLSVPKPGAGTPLTIKDESGGAASNNITIAAASGETIDGASSVAITTNYGYVTLLSNGAGWSVIT